MEIHVRHQNTFSKNKILANEIPVQGVVPKNADTAPPQFGDISPKPKTNRLGPPNTGGPRHRQTLAQGGRGIVKLWQNGRPQIREPSWVPKSGVMYDTPLKHRVARSAGPLSQ